MQKTDTKNKANLKLTKKSLVIVAAVVLLGLITVWLFLAVQPQRTVANFCSVAKEENPNFQAGANHTALLSAFKKLDAVAPDEIHSETSSVVDGYQSIVNDSSKTTTAELGMANSQLKISSYISKSCPDY